MYFETRVLWLDKLVVSVAETEQLPPHAVGREVSICGANTHPGPPHGAGPTSSSSRDLVPMVSHNPYNQ